MALTDYLILSDRSTGQRKPIKIIDYARFDAFFEELSQADINPIAKTYIAIAISGGLRVSEVLLLTRKDIDLDTGFITVQVLKKKVPTTRTAILHPIAKMILKEYLLKNKIRHFGRIFSVTRQAIFKQVQAIFGADASPHSICRHSCFSYMLHSLDMSAAAVSKTMKVELHVVSSYNHVNTQKVLYSMFPNRSAPSLDKMNLEQLKELCLKLIAQVNK